MGIILNTKMEREGRTLRIVMIEWEQGFMTIRTETGGSDTDMLAMETLHHSRRFEAMCEITEQVGKFLAETQR